MTKKADAERRCIVRRAVRPRDELIRFVIGPEDRVVPDLAGKLPGRGVWVSADWGAVAEAAKKGLFARAFKAAAKPPDGLADEVARQLRARALGFLALANKAGQAVAGFEKVRALIARGRADVLIAADDAGDDGADRLEGAFHAALKQARAERESGGEDGHERGEDHGENAGKRTLAVFTRSELGLALGRDSVVHAALTRHGLADQVLESALRLVAYERTRGP